MHTAKQPNVILVMTDDQGWGDVAYNGNPMENMRTQLLAWSAACDADVAR